MLAISIQKYYIFVLLFLLAILQSSCQQSGNKYRILVVHSYESDYVAYKDCDRLIRESLEKKGINPSIQTFYLNCEQYAAPAEEKRMYLYLGHFSIKEYNTVAKPLTRNRLKKVYGKRKNSSRWL